jgi:hypothetical protein
MTEQLEILAASETTPPEVLVKLVRSDVKLARIVAKNVAATPELLAALTVSTDEITRRNVAGNPNTPMEILWGLGEEFPEELIENPILSLWFLENPNFLANVPHKSIISLLKHESIPNWFLELAVNINNDDVIRTLLMLSQTSKNVLQKILIDVDGYEYIDDVRSEVYLHVNWSGDIESGWNEIAWEKINKIFAEGYFFIDKEKEILNTIGILPEYITDEDASQENEQLNISMNFLTSSHILEELLGCDRDDVRIAASDNLNTPFDVICEYKSQEQAINNPITSAEDLAYLAGSRWQRIRKGVAFHPNISPATLAKLALDENIEVVKSVALNINVPIQILENLADIFPDIVTAHPYCPHSLLEKIFHRGYQHEINPEYSPSFINIAQHPSTPAKIIEKLAEIGYELQVAQNHKTPVEILIELSKHSDDKVRSHVAQNPNTPVDILRYLAYTDRTVIVNNAAKNQIDRQRYRRYLPDIYPLFQGLIFEYPISLKETNKKLASENNIPNWHLSSLFFPSSNNHQFIINKSELETVSITQLQQDSKNQNPRIRISTAINSKLPIDCLQKLAQDTDESVRMAVAINPQTTTSILEQLASDNSIKIREIVASNSRTPINTLIKLAEDESSEVQVAVVRNLNTPIHIIDKLADKLSGNSNPDIKYAIVKRIKFIPEELAFFSQILKKLLYSVDKYIIQKLEIFPQILQQSLEQLFAEFRETGKLTKIFEQYPHASLKMLRLQIFLHIAKKNSHTFRNSALQNLCDRILFDINTPREIIEAIAQLKNLDNYPYKLGNINLNFINLIIARHPHTSSATLEKLTSHENNRIRIAVAQHQDTPAHILEILLQDNEYNVRHTAIATCERHPSYCDRFQDLIVAWKTIQNPQVSNQTLEQLATSEWLILREAVALHPKTPITILEQLVKDFNSEVRLVARDFYSKVRLAVAKNPNTPADLLEQILTTSDNITVHTISKNTIIAIKEIKVAIANHQNARIQLLEKLANENSREEESHQIAVKNLILRQAPQIENILTTYIEKNSSQLMKLSVLLQPLTSINILTKYSRSPLWWERYAVAKNPRTPLKVREKLIQDGNRIVRAAARSN